MSGVGLETQVRAALVAWLARSGGLAGMLSSISEETPARPTLPWLAIAGSSAVDWSTKTEVGAEVRVSLQIACRGDQPGDAAALVTALDAAVMAMPAAQAGFAIVSVRFLKSRSAQSGPLGRAVSVDYRFRVLAA